MGGRSEDGLAVQLMFYSTFEVLDLPGSGPMESRGIVKVYGPSPTPILYVGPVSNVLGPVSLMPLNLLGNSTPTIPAALPEALFHHGFRNLQRSKFPHGCADVAKEPGRKGSNVYEANQSSETLRQRRVSPRKLYANHPGRTA